MNKHADVSSIDRLNLGNNGFQTTLQRAYWKSYTDTIIWLMQLFDWCNYLIDAMFVLAAHDDNNAYIRCCNIYVPEKQCKKTFNGKSRLQDKLLSELCFAFGDFVCVLLLFPMVVVDLSVVCKIAIVFSMRKANKFLNCLDWHAKWVSGALEPTEFKSEGKTLVSAIFEQMQQKMKL